MAQSGWATAAWLPGSSASSFAGRATLENRGDFASGVSAPRKRWQPRFSEQRRTSSSFLPAARRSGVEALPTDRPSALTRPWTSVAALAAGATLPLLQRRDMQLRKRQDSAYGHPAASTRLHARWQESKQQTSSRWPIVCYLMAMLVHRLLLRILGFGVALSVPAMRSTVAQTWVFGILALLQRTGTPDSSKGANQVPNSRLLQLLPAALFVLVAVLEIVSGIVLQKLRLVPAQAGGILALLSGIALLTTIEMSNVLLRRRYPKLTWFAAIVVIFGVEISEPGGTTSLASMAWDAQTLQALAIIAAIFYVQGLSLIGKEVLLKVTRVWGQARPMSLYTVAFLASSAQLTVLANYPLDGTDTAPSSFLAKPELGAATAYTITSAFSRLALIWALQSTSAVAVQFANAVAIPLSSILLMAPFISQQVLLGQAVALVGGGLAILASEARRRREKKSKIKITTTDPK
eukprot:TRINITY_DN112311_c0_g1_i1.p1 TRINITY_DN112311_c0_g1~~TRINITY_DN112311_c0_g1_i1.p1  ORF type:complete len:463 (+),score=112.73 TRINITY_DN112311_c0_g1_i1:138-1526(+)